jgi:hypothetical protein
MTLDMEKLHDRRVIDWVALWILFSTWCSLTGWFLSLLDCLNRWGYGMAFAFFLGGLIVFRKQLGLSGPKLTFFKTSLLHSRRLLPQIWLLLTSLVLIGGLVYHPNNYDYLTYRFPRVLHWCWEQRWHWIDTVNQRMDFSGTGTEWLMTPLFLFFKTDRLFFLINFIPFLLFPGLIFSVFCGLGISKRISWWWMWVLPCGYCYLLEAVSAGNDFPGAIYLLAALHYAFKTRESCATKNFALSCLSIALLTGIKVSNAPLVLPWLAALFFNGRPLLRRGKPAVIIMVLAIAAMISFLPTALLNAHFTGDYSGDPANQCKVKVPDPISGIVGNSLQLAAHNLAPPVWLKPLSWEKIIPGSFKERLARDFPRFDVTVGEMQMEEGAGVGIGIVACVGLMAGFGSRALFAKTNKRIVRNAFSIGITAAAAAALLVYMSKIGSEATSRLIAAYYPLLIAGVLVLASLDERIMKRSLLKIVGAAAMLSALPLVILSPSRPLFPTGMVAQYLAKMAPSALVRFNLVYGVYASRFDDLKDLRVYIPKNENAIGFLQGGDDPEVSLWRPFGSRQVIDVGPEKSADELKMLHVHFVVVSGDALEERYHIKIDDLAKKWTATVIAEKDLAIKAHTGWEPWYVVYRP